MAPITCLIPKLLLEKLPSFKQEIASFTSIAEMLKKLIQVLIVTTFPLCLNIQLSLTRIILPWIALVSLAETSLHLPAELLQPRGQGEPGNGKKVLRSTMTMENNWTPISFAKAEPVPADES